MTHASLALMAGAVALMTAAPALAQTADTRPEIVDRLVACRAIADAGQRLACFDQGVAALDAAERAGDLVVVDREQVRETRRQLFGFSLPAMPVFEARGESVEAVDSVTTTLTSARRLPDGKMVFSLEDGSVWRQIDFDRYNGSTRAGSAVEIRRATLGSYMLSVGGARSVRVSRDR